MFEFPYCFCCLRCCFFFKKKLNAIPNESKMWFTHTSVYKRLKEEVLFRDNPPTTITATRRNIRKKSKIRPGETCQKDDTHFLLLCENSSQSRPHLCGPTAAVFGRFHHSRHFSGPLKRHRHRSKSASSINHVFSS